ncbi:MAG: sigma-54-dependent Fis family transcriptional regulator [Pirellulales bacterium]|nr:sigma-54-dependent Fis family transcriptional regulator [Pirellulales bacterium]
MRVRSLHNLHEIPWDGASWRKDLSVLEISRPAQLLIVDDEPAILQLFRRIFEFPEIRILTAETAVDGLEAARLHHPDVILLDVLLPDGSGLDMFRKIRVINPQVPIIMITSLGDADTAIEAMELGALDYLVKPLEVVELRKVVARALEIRRLMNDPVKMEMDPPSPVEVHGDILIGRCPAMQKVYKAIGLVARQHVAVLVRGESGTGKELVARALYQHSQRSHAPFLAVNCAAIPEGLLESELFGHEKGSFTGADRRRIGKFEQCHHGTLFLDEIGDMTPLLQSKLLRVLQEQQFERIGGNETIATDVRVITATNRNLEQMVAANEFRSDLYYRLNGYSIHLPPLRERGNDLDLLVDRFRLVANTDLGKDFCRIAPEAMTCLRAYPWPGNIRELQSVVRQAVLQGTGNVLLADFLPEFVRDFQHKMHSTPRCEKDRVTSLVEKMIEQRADNIYDQVMQDTERLIISRVLQHTDGNQLEAARLLGVTRTTLRSKLQRLGIKIDKIVQAGSE